MRTLSAFAHSLISAALLLATSSCFDDASGEGGDGTGDTGGTDDGSTDDGGDTGGTGTGGCSPGTMECNGSCVDISNDTQHCGECGNTCADAQVCVSGSCVNDCPEGTEVCGGSCVDTQTNGEHCGECDNACTGDEVCASGNCSTDCDAGLTACASSCVDTSTDSNNCGSCGVICDDDKACVAGECAPLSEVAKLEVTGRWLDPTGWTDPEDNPIKATFKQVPVVDAVYECRTAKLGQVTSKPFAPCDGGSGTTPSYEPTPPDTNDEGMFGTHARVRVGSYASPTVKFDYYVHRSLDGAPLCGTAFTDEDVFAYAAGVLSTTETFASTLKTRNPFITLPFEAVSKSNGMAWGEGGTWYSNTDKWATITDYTAEILSLRRRFVVNPDNTLVLMHRRRQSRRALAFDDTANVCRNGFKFGDTITTPIALEHCEFFVVNAHGRGVCLYDNGGALATALTSATGWFKLGEQDRFSAKGTTEACPDSLKSANGNPGECAWYLYLPQ